VKALAKQKPHLVDSFAPIPTTIIRGETLLGITYVQYVAQQPGPIGYASLEKYLADPSDLGLSAKAANLVFMDNPTVEQLKKLQSDFREIFFGR